MVPASLMLNLLGGFRVSRHHQPLSQFPTVKGRALLAYLAVEASMQPDPNPQVRTTLAGLLWPDIAEQYALRNLTQTLVRLRQALGDTGGEPPFLVLTRATVQINPDYYSQIDVRQFITAANTGRHNGDVAQLEKALALYQGELLADFTLADSEFFQEWVLFKREALHQLALDTAHVLTSIYLTTGAYAKAEQAAKRQLALDSWRESAHRQLMEALARTGQRNAALLQYETCRRTLLAELGVEPEPATTALYRQIYNNLLREPEIRREENEVSSSNENGVSRQPDWREAPDLGPFYGRETELETVTNWLLDSGCRLVALVGMGGVGKTALAAQTVQRTADQFELVIWRSLLNAPPLAELLRGCLATLSAQQLRELPTTLDEQIELFLHYLRKHRCLIVLDNLESILQGGETTLLYRPDYAGYGQLLLRIGQTQQQSCLVITSRETPPEFTRMTSPDPKQGKVRVLTLRGLASEAAQVLLREHGLNGSGINTATLVQHYSGHPLALKLVADTIRDFYAGNVEAFLSGDALIFDDIRTVLDQQFNRLSRLEQEILIWLAIEREPVDIQTLQGNLVQALPRRTILEAVRSLWQRSLLETQGAGFSLQNVVTEYVTGRLIDSVCHELTTQNLQWVARHALLKANGKAYIRQSQARLLLQPIAQQLAQNLGEAGVHTLFRTLLDRLRSAPALPNYAAGNVLNLLLGLGYAVAGYDFSQLCIRQAYLRDLATPGLNFAHAKLVDVVFTDTFASVLSVQLTPDGTRLLAGCADGTIRLWRVTDGQSIGLFTGHTGIVWAIAVSPDGRLLASGSDDRTVRIWDIETGQLLHLLQGHIHIVHALAFSSGGEWLASSGWDQTVRIWDTRTGCLVRTVGGWFGSVDALAFSPERSQPAFLATAGANPTIHIWDLATGTVRHELHSHMRRVLSLTFSPDGATLLSSGHEQDVRVWDTATWQLRSQLIGHTNTVGRVVLSADGTTVVSGSYDKTVRLWDLQSGQLRRTLQGHTGWIHSVACTPDGLTVASGGSDQTVRLWDTQRGEALHILSGHINWVPALALTPNGATLVSGHWDHGVRVWDMVTGQLRCTLRRHHDRVTTVACSPDGVTAASGSSDSSICIWHLPTGQLRHVLQGHPNGVLDVAFHPSGLHVASSGQDGTIRIWDVATGRLMHQLMAHDDEVRSIVFHSDGNLFVSGSLDRTIRLWDTRTWQPIRRLEIPGVDLGKVCSLALNSDGTRLAVGYLEGTVALWDITSGALLHQLYGHTILVSEVAFSPDDHLLASCSEDTTIRLWEVETGQACKVWPAHAIRTTTVSFWPQAEPRMSITRRLVSGGCDELIKVWDVETADYLQTLRPPGPYEGMNITGVTGISETQKVALKALGAQEEETV